MSCRIHHIAWITLVILSSLQDVLGLAWVEKPSDTTSVIGGDATFNCDYTGANLATWAGPQGSLFVNNISMATDNRFSIRGLFNLHISNVKKQDQGEYTCTVQGLPPEKGYLNVYIPPHNISVITNDTRPSQVEGDFVSLTCSSIGNPPPEITWFREDSQLTDSATIQIIQKPSIGHGNIETLVTSQLIIKLQYTDHNKNFYCSAKNDVNLNNPSKVPFLVQVQYKPRITLEPSPLNILLGSSSQLRCIVSANPQVTRVRWQKDTQVLQDTEAVLRFLSVDRTAAGQYTCSASNTINGQVQTDSKSTSVQVIYPPIITVPATAVVNDSGVLHLHCAVDANPPPLSVKWRKLDSSRESTSANFTASPVTRDYEGNYTCIVMYRLEPSGQSVEQSQKFAYTYVYVQYAPGYSSIKAVSSSVSIGETISLTCSVSEPGYPLPKYEWRKIDTDRVLSSQGSTLTIQSAGLADNGQYACTPYNVMGRGGTATIIVEVLESPSFVESPPTSATITSNQSMYSVLCKVRGLPKPKLEWLKNGQTIQSGPMYNITEEVTSIETYSKLVSSRLLFAGTGRQGLMIDDIANFTCREVSGGEQHNLELYIMFKPSVDADEKVATTVNHSTTMTCRGKGYPVPTFEWFRDNKIIQSESRFTVEPTIQLGATEASSSLSIRDVVAGDFGEYVCIGQNSNGQAHKTVRLTVKNRPEAPYNLSVISYTWESVYLRWTPGFNGGEPQSFHIHFTSSVPPIYTGDIIVSPPDATQHNITDLLPGVAYQFYVYGKNSLGKGNNSQKIIIKTKDFAFPLVNNIPDYSAENKRLMIPFTLNSTYCVKVKISVNGGSTWQTIPMSGRECFPATEDTRELSLQSDSINRLNVSICLSVRPDICGVHLAALISGNPKYGFQRQADKTDLSETEVIIIGVICAVILLSLIIVLIVIICRRRTNAKHYGNPSTSVSRPVTTTLQTNGNSLGPPKPQRGQDNQGSLGNGFDPPPQYQSVVKNGSIPLDTSYDSQLAKYENELNMRNMHNLKNEAYFGVQNGSPSTPRKDPHHFLEAPEDRKDISKGGQESGYSTPDGHVKPKKIRNHKQKHKEPKDFEKTVYYSDFVPFAHDPPGHTCGLPCCNSDLYIRLKVSGHHAGCMSMPFQQPKTEDAEENFTLRRNQLHLLKGKPTFKNGGFYSVQHHRNEQRKGVPSFGSLPRYKTEQRHFFQGRGITLPRIDLSHSSSDKTKRCDQTESDDSESSSESSICFQTLGNIKNRKIPQKRCGSDMPQLPRIHPMELLEARRKFGIADDNEFEDSSSSTDESNYYNEIVMSNFKLQETNPNEKAKSDISDEVFLPQKEPTYYTLNLDKTFVFDSKRNTLERMTGQEKYPDLSSYKSVGLDNQKILSTEIPKREQFSKGKGDMNINDVDKATTNGSNWKEQALPIKSSEGIGTNCSTPTKVALKSALKSRSLQHHRRKRKVTHALKTTSLDRDGNLKHGIENRGFVADGRCMLEGFEHNEDRFARHGHHLDTIDESPITLIL